MKDKTSRSPYFPPSFGSVGLTCSFWGSFGPSRSWKPTYAIQLGWVLVGETV